jgi:hypothetical protein
MKFAELNYGFLGEEVKLKSLKNSKIKEDEIIKKGKIYKIYDIAKDYFKEDKKTIRLVDKNMNTFWVNHYDIEPI